MLCNSIKLNAMQYNVMKKRMNNKQKKKNEINKKYIIKQNKS